MAEFKDPFHGAVIDVPDELAKRYTDAGYTPVKKAAARGKRGDTKPEPESTPEAETRPEGDEK